MYFNQEKYLKDYALKFPAIQAQTVITIGNFDGLHLGHQKLIQENIRLAQEQSTLGNQLQSLALIFDPNPFEVITAQHFRKISTAESRQKQIQALGIQNCLVLDFNKDLADCSAYNFCKIVLKERFNVHSLVVGYDFRLGSSAYSHNLEEICQELGINLVRIQAEKVEIDGQETIISSSKIREYLQKGEIEAANLMLGKAFAIEGKVIHGFGRGRSVLGIATANLEHQASALLKTGAYKTYVRINGSHKEYLALTNVGYNPSFANKTISVETHILDFEQDIYGDILTLYFAKYIRQEQKFADLQELKAQILADIQAVRAE